MSLGITMFNVVNQIIIQQNNIKHEIRENDHMSQGFFISWELKNEYDF
jgi:hypothetical protein